MELVYRKFKRRRIGPCNICGVVGPLSWDHVPPKGGIELEPVEIDRVIPARMMRIQPHGPVNHLRVTLTISCVDHKECHQGG